MEIQEQLEAVRAYKGTVRISVGANTVDANVWSTQHVPENKGIPEHINAGFQLLAKPEQLISIQQEVIDDLLMQNFCSISVLAQTRSSWDIRESMELLKNEHGDYRWLIHARIFL
uniref:Uncharacterized protein n=1 Tax=Pseudomonas phage HRDY3 TaxID=3236930 RepID=A0AB39CED3_9VIRU